MAYVSIEQVESLEEAIAGLQSTYDSMESACQVQIAATEAKLTEVQQEADNSAQLMDASMEAEMGAGQQLEQANEQLSSANEQLSSAYLSLSACEARGSYNDDDNNYEPPNCSSEEANIAAAESAVTEAASAVKAAEEALEAAKDHRMQMEQRNEMARQCLDMATQLAETVQTECAARIASAAAHLERGKARLESAKVALNAYLDTHPPAADFYAWLKWTPDSSKPVTPKELHSRLNLSVQQQRYYFEYLTDRDPVFRAKIADYRSQLEAANGPAERHAVQLKIRRNLSGYCGEKIVEQALSPLGHKTDTQARTTFEDGRFTKTDLIIEDLKVPVILGRGEGMSAPTGGSIAIEVKCGRASYLYSQKDHMVFQSGGHQEANASMTVCSRDIKDLTPEQEKELREALRSAGSPLLGMLPTKDEIDKASWDIVNGSNANNGGTLEN
ncbi:MULTISPECIES: hypothetical protein [Vibrio]|uniref:Uncharacterized protein n=1 Tax=Vibrio halioticoli NBRC 102217 TaxID=1219072 RepID=V5F303_9VIBR|nr:MULTISPECIES: hypothetical protein [Vibrio]MPW36550.1 hypothetical protein [Vibrio sp. B1Z05]GAD89529.1 hypothetical protein VHA01S_021_00230 [Vibrio halioticoli NBRC 102217]